MHQDCDRVESLERFQGQLEDLGFETPSYFHLIDESQESYYIGTICRAFDDVINLESLRRQFENGQKLPSGIRSRPHGGDQSAALGCLTTYAIWPNTIILSPSLF